jgi:hypothetical protein
LNFLPNYYGEKEITIKEKMGYFQDFMENIFLEHDDVFMRIFVQNIEGDVMKWFIGLTHISINTWKFLETTCLRQWGENRYHLYYLTKCVSLKNKDIEFVV